MVIVSNGFQKFHLSVAAAEANKRGTLSGYLTGAYPTPAIRKILALPVLRNSAKLKRLVARHDEIPESLVRPLFLPEVVYAFGTLLKSEARIVDSFRYFGRSATKYVERAAAGGARVYHYRAAFGGPSVQVAKKLGMVALCDHSIAHPAVVEHLVDNMGRMPAHAEDEKMSPFNKYILEDIEQADAVVVNSDFVKDTFIGIGRTEIPVHVIYWGVDDAFLERVPERVPSTGQPRILFAGYFQKRKGADTLIDALAQLGDRPWQLKVAGGVEVGMDARYPAFFSDPRVKFLGLLSRKELAPTMSRHDIFVFPSLAEGSARVVFEAMACGCYIITTPNTGSIVQDKVHGRLVPPGDVNALSAAIEDALSNPSRVAEIGSRNAQLIRTSYRQSQYGENLAALYAELLATKQAVAQ
jgi:glycosyltransferase involved in cell wall biosynthesis